MRNDIVHIGAGELNYEIRNIIKVVEKVKALDCSGSGNGDIGDFEVLKVPASLSRQLNRTTTAFKGQPRSSGSISEL